MPADARAVGAVADTTQPTAAGVSVRKGRTPPGVVTGVLCRQGGTPGHGHGCTQGQAGPSLAWASLRPVMVSRERGERETTGCVLEPAGAPPRKDTPLTGAAGETGRWPVGGKGTLHHFKKK